ncbi:pyrroline-5-carboxylate reductase [Paraphotobacterium marinum]|uniref:Pyrroline-5-carboxylate reductase n=1 Tax=Paraphotobacterium marinum TaxID=1755811 RepID=A0A220VFM1_9GAMM|nr:pyrroline-5-carboxylate reductase [Paraphotobacterium marinum]ASK79101.1 pyrroline-5-carboxylate reductase [Paraphotobacterium marinum]
MDIFSKKICFIGSGNMTRSILAGLIKEGMPAQNITVTAPSDHKRKKLKEEFNVIETNSNRDAILNSEIIILSVKPQMMQLVCEELNDMDLSSKKVISLAAGIKIQKYELWFNQKLQLIRVMPNTPSLIGQGVSGMFAPHFIDQSFKKMTESLMSSIGKTIWLKNEEQINDIIALSGSSPAYFFLFLQAMQEFASTLGFEEKEAKEIVLQAAQGSIALANFETNKSFKTLRENVTSKGGTTAAAIENFQQNNFENIIKESMNAAIKRAIQMENEF